MTADLLASVERHFVATSEGLATWKDPHANGSPPEDSYSRLTNPERYLIVWARAEAWLLALEEHGLATIERDVDARWQEAPATVTSHVSRATPTSPDALTLLVAHSLISDFRPTEAQSWEDPTPLRLGGEFGVTIGVGDPAICVGWIPHCGCDACDDGSQHELDRIDEWIAGVAAGTFRHLSKKDSMITAFDANGWSASGQLRPGEAERALAGARGWAEVSGPPWQSGSQIQHLIDGR